MTQIQNALALPLSPGRTDHLDLEIGAYLEFGIWSLEFGASLSLCPMLPPP